MMDNLLAQWEILKMKAAYIAAERQIISDAQKGIDLTGFNEATTIAFEPMSPQDFFQAEVDAFGNMKKLSEADVIFEKAKEVRKKLDNALDEENYLKAEMFQNILNGLEKQYNRLKGYE